MKNIELTENHRSKLLEMCKVLFPEYTEIYLGINDYDDNFDGFIYFQKTIPLISNTINDIHWFEFCWKILNKILSNEEKTNPVYVHECVVNFGMICFNNSSFQHPIDYLYEIFKQNEKN